MVLPENVRFSNLQVSYSSGTVWKHHNNNNNTSIKRTWDIFQKQTELTNGRFLRENVTIKTTHPLSLLLQGGSPLATSDTPLLISVSKRQTPQGSQGGVRQSGSGTGWQIFPSGQVFVGSTEGTE